MRLYHWDSYSIEQACQTQTTLQAKKATKTVEGAAKVLKNILAGYIWPKLEVENDLIMLYNNIFSTQIKPFIQI